MQSYYSLIRYVNNSLSKENFVIGLVAISNTNIYYRFSDSKIKFISRLLENNNDLLTYNVKKLKEHLKINANDKLFIQENSLHLKQYIDRLSIYSNGLMQFDKPIELSMDINESFFNKFYDKYIGDFKSNSRDNRVDPLFVKRIEDNFRKPLQNIIDVDYRIGKNEIPSLFFDYRLNGLGVNDSIYSVKCIDINSNRTLENIQKDISELESLSYRLNKFSQDKVENYKNNKHFLVMDPYNGLDDKYTDLYETLSNQKNEIYKLVNSLFLEEITSEIITAEARKFSALIE